jgi:hypothetical protein
VGPGVWNRAVLASWNGVVVQWVGYSGVVTEVFDLLNFCHGTELENEEERPGRTAKANKWQM